MWARGEMKPKNMEAEGTFTSQIVLSESLYHLGYFLHGNNFTLITRQVTLQCAFVRKMIQPMKILFENVDSVEYCSGEEYALGIWKLGFDFSLCRLPV